MPMRHDLYCGIRIRQSDELGSRRHGGGADTQYLLNHRSYLTAVRHIWGDLYLSFEWNHLMTKWSTGESFSGDNFMISTWYNF